MTWESMLYCDAEEAPIYSRWERDARCWVLSWWAMKAMHKKERLDLGSPHCVGGAVQPA